ncbi:hypothetical protein Lepto7375DRAFT_7581 [Leptolyngbya sp. PCC 7375]|nr:hypothetical protein Lepto7375DRAFT_7581 [Leptolyngbya sp. PCC 7375]
MKNQLLTGALAAATLAVTSVVQATPVRALTFDFTGPEGVFPSLNFSQGDISVTATGTDLFFDRNVFQNNDGLGVTFSTSNLENNEVDGLGLDETLNLEFSEQVNLVSATFSRVGFNDQFRLLVDGNQLVQADIPNSDLFDSFFDLDVGIFNFSPSPTGSLFGFTVTDFNDDYLLRAVEVTPVPTPAAVLPGLFGMGMAAFRKKNQNQENAHEV